MFSGNDAGFKTDWIERLEDRRFLRITLEVVEVPITAAAISEAPQLASYRSFDLRATLTPGDHFNIAGMDAVLRDGAQFYQHPRGGTVSRPDLWPLYPAAEFDTFVQSPNDFPTDVIFPGTSGEPPIQPSKVSIDWSPGPGVQTGSGQFTIARLTIPVNAHGYVFARGFSLNSVPDTRMSTFAVAALPNPSAESAWIGGYTVTDPNVTPFGMGETGVYLDVNGNGQRDAEDVNPIRGNRVPSLTENLRRGQSHWGFVVPAGRHSLNMISSSSAGVSHDSVVETVEANPRDYVFRNKFRVPESSASLYVRGWTIQPFARLVGDALESNSFFAFVDLDDDSVSDPGEPYVGSSSSFSGQRVVSGITPGTHRVRFISSVQGYVTAPSYPWSHLVEFEAGKVAQIEFFFVQQNLLRSLSSNRLPELQRVIFSQKLLDVSAPVLDLDEEVSTRSR